MHKACDQRLQRLSIATVSDAQSNKIVPQDSSLRSSSLRTHLASHSSNVIDRVQVRHTPAPPDSAPDPHPVPVHVYCVCTRSYAPRRLIIYYCSEVWCHRPRMDPNARLAVRRCNRECCLKSQVLITLKVTGNLIDKVLVTSCFSLQLFCWHGGTNRTCLGMS